MNRPIRGLIEGKPVLVVIDAHRKVFPRIADLIEAARRHRVPIIFANAADNETAVAAGPMPGESATHPKKSAPWPDEYVIRPRRHSVFFGTELPILLQELGAGTVILAGGETNTCVHYSFLDAHQYDYFCRVVEDCVEGSSPQAHEGALRAMEYMQTGARRTCDEVIPALGAACHAAAPVPVQTSATSTTRAPLIVGKPVLLVIDLQGDISTPRHDPLRDFPMPDYEVYMQRVPALIAAARACNVPIVYMQEVHHPSMIDFGRELDGFERVHCLENAPRTAIVPEVDRRPDDYWVRKRRYSSFFDTDLEILLRGLKATTLLMVGGFSDVCVHYAFADAHQRDYVCRVVEDCVAGSSRSAHETALAAMEHLQPDSRCVRDELIVALRSWVATAASG
jgi:nicotinamidase-related amidase